MSENSNYTKTPRCPKVVGTNCIEYQGAAIECLDICTGDMLTETQFAIATAVCELIAATDATTIELPECLVTAWGTNDETVLNFLQFILDQLCYQQSLIDNLTTSISTIDPMMSIDYKCCSDNPCVTTGVVTMSQALQNIVNCLCDTKTELAALQEYVGTSGSITDLSAAVVTLQSQMAGVAALAANWQTNRVIIGAAGAFPIAVVS